VFDLQQTAMSHDCCYSGPCYGILWVELPTMVVDDMIGCVLLFKNGVEVPCVVDECLTGSTCALFSMKKALAPEDTRS
jgi:hypothetical protein